MYSVGHANKNLNKSGQNDKIMGILNFQGHNWLFDLGCLVGKQNSFEVLERTLDQLQALSQNTLFEWAKCWGYSNCSSALEFFSTLSSASVFCVHHHEHL